MEHWGRRIDRLEEEVERQRSRLEEERPPELCEDRPHLFVDAALGRVVGANHERVLQGFQRLRLQLEKSRFRMLRDGPS